jgi:hypothetical protein
VRSSSGNGSSVIYVSDLRHTSVHSVLKVTRVIFGFFLY